MEQKYVNKVYENIAKNFSDKRRYKWSWIDEFIFSKSKNTNILDIGCGNGRNMEYEGYNFTGVDNCYNFTKICKDKKLNVILSDMTTLPFEDNTFDYIISIASFHHLSNDERREQALKEMKRVIKKNGEILLSVWSIDQSHNKKLNFVYGDNFVPWKDKNNNIVEQRYYYIFNKNDLNKLISKYFIIKEWKYIHGNEIIYLSS